MKESCCSNLLWYFWMVVQVFHLEWSSVAEVWFSGQVKAHSWNYAFLADSSIYVKHSLYLLSFSFHFYVSDNLFSFRYSGSSKLVVRLLLCITPLDIPSLSLLLLKLRDSVTNALYIVYSFPYARLVIWNRITFPFYGYLKPLWIIIHLLYNKLLDTFSRSQKVSSIRHNAFARFNFFDCLLDMELFR